MPIELKMVRTAINLLTLLSLLLRTGVVVLWVRDASRNTNLGVSDEEEFAARLVRRTATTSVQYECGINCQGRGMMWYGFGGAATPADPGWGATPGWSTVYARSTSNVLVFASPRRRWWSNFNV